MNVERLFQYNKKDFDDENEDLKTHFAKRRSARQSVNEQEGNLAQDRKQASLCKTNVSNVETTLGYEDGTTSKKARVGKTPEHQAITHGGFAAPEPAQVRQPLTNPKFFMSFDELEDPLYIEDRTTPPVVHTHEDESSLFVQQQTDIASSVESSRTGPSARLLPSNYDSSSEDSAYQADKVRSSRKTSAQVSAYKHTLAIPTSKISTAKFTKSLRENPYLSGVFSHKELSKDMALARVSNQTGDSRKRKRDATPDDSRLSNMVVIDSPTFTEKQKLQQHITPTHAATDDVQAMGGRQVQAGAPPVLVKPKVIDLELQDFLQAKVKDSKAALAKFGSDQPGEQEAWRVLAPQVLPDAEALVNEFRDGHDSVRKLKDAIDRLERAMSLRVALHRRILYDILLQRSR